jgi:hypothetical protein
MTDTQPKASFLQCAAHPRQYAVQSLRGGAHAEDYKKTLFWGRVLFPTLASIERASDPNVLRALPELAFVSWDAAMEPGLDPEVRDRRLERAYAAAKSYLEKTEEGSAPSTNRLLCQSIESCCVRYGCAQNSRQSTGDLFDIGYAFRNDSMDNGARITILKNKEMIDQKPEHEREWAARATYRLRHFTGSPSQISFEPLAHLELREKDIVAQDTNRAHNRPA